MAGRAGRGDGELATDSSCECHFPFARRVPEPPGSPVKQNSSGSLIGLDCVCFPRKWLTKRGQERQDKSLKV